MARRPDRRAAVRPLEKSCFTLLVPVLLPLLRTEPATGGEGSPFAEKAPLEPLPAAAEHCPTCPAK